MTRPIPARMRAALAGLVLVTAASAAGAEVLDNRASFAVTVQCRSCCPRNDASRPIQPSSRSAAGRDETQLTAC